MKRCLYILLLVGAVSCNKYLEKKNDQSFLIPTTLRDLSLLLANSNVLNVETTPDLVESACDDVRIDSALFRLIQGDNIVRSAFTWQLRSHVDYKFGLSAAWSKPYAAIYQANICLEKVDKVAKTAANSREWNKVKGSALFFRAYYLAQLCWTFAKNYDEQNNTDPGVVIKLVNDFNIPSRRSTVKECYQQVIKDAMTSLEYLEVGSENVFIPNKKATYGLLSRVYLSMLKYDSAFHYANLFLEKQNALLDFNNPAEVNLSSQFPIKEYSSEVAFISSMATSALGFSGHAYAADSALYNSYDDHDLRKQVYFWKYYNGTFLYPGASNTIFMQRARFTGLSTAEMLVTRAEGYARMNKPDEALADLNLLRSKRFETAFYTPVTTRTQPELLQLILQERRRELVGRGLRWMDLKRLNKEFSNIIVRHYDYSEQKYYTLAPNDAKYALPIPRDIIDLTGMPQN